MKRFITTWLVNTVALLVVTRMVSGIVVDTWTTAFVAALVLGLCNAFLRPLIVLITLPINILSLGLFTLVINSLMFYLAAKLVRGFSVMSFWSAFWGALLFSIVSFLLNIVAGASSGAAVHHTPPRRPRDQHFDNVIDVDAVPTEEKDKKKHLA